MNGEIIEFNKEKGVGVVVVFNSRGIDKLPFVDTKKEFEAGELVVFGLKEVGGMYIATNVQHK